MRLHAPPLSPAAWPPPPVFEVGESEYQVPTGRPRVLEGVSMGRAFGAAARAVKYGAAGRNLHVHVADSGFFYIYFLVIIHRIQGCRKICIIMRQSPHIKTWSTRYPEPNPLPVETGRWGPARRQREERVCPHCASAGVAAVQDVQHMLGACPAYAPVRHRFSQLFQRHPLPFSEFLQQDPGQLACFARHCWQRHRELQS